jgi:HD-GYP domain-containing protein (c-di-GMP phosphodiesterase class II)
VPPLNIKVAVFLWGKANMPTTADIGKSLGNLAAVIDNNAGLALLSRDFHIVWVNPTQQKWFGEDTVLVGRHCYEAFERRKHICRGCPCKKAFAEGKVHQAFRPGIIATGERRFYQITANPIKDKTGKVIQVLELVQDVNDYLKDDKIRRRRLVKLEKICNRLKSANMKLRCDRIRLKNIGRKTYEVGRDLSKKYRHLLKQLVSTKKELHDLFVVNKMVCLNGDASKTTSLITKLSRHILHADAASIRLVDNERRMLIPKAALGLSKATLIETPMKIGEGLEGLVALNGKYLISKDMQHDPRVIHLDKIKAENIRSALIVPAIFKRQILAVIAIFYRRIRGFSREEIELMQTFASQVAIAIQETQQCDDVHRNYFNTLKALVLAMEARDPYTRGHSERVTKYALDIARKLHMPQKFIEIINYAGIVHDVGKIGISDLILNKPGRLTAAERAIIELHPIKGVQMLEPLKFIRTGLPLVRHHHERFDGTGYPDRIGGEEIPLSARILACADAFDAMTSDRPYRLKKLTAQDAITELKANANTQFDPKIVSVFVDLIKKEKYVS